MPTAAVEGTAAASSPLKVKPSMCGPTPATAKSPPASKPVRSESHRLPTQTSRSVIATPASTAPSLIAQAEWAIEISTR